MTRAEHIARAHIAASNCNDQASMVENFHPDAEWIPIAPVEPLRRLEKIRERYLNEVRALNAPIIREVYVADEHRCRRHSKTAAVSWRLSSTIQSTGASPSSTSSTLTMMAWSLGWPSTHADACIVPPGIGLRNAGSGSAPTSHPPV